MNMTRFLAAKKETDAAEPMNADTHTGASAHGRFNLADGAEPLPIKQSGRGEEHRVKNLRRPWNSREPFQPPNSEREDYVSAFSTGARSATEGPFSTLPSASKREPWQGQSHVVSFRFQCTIHFRCGQTAVISCSVPASSRYTAIFFAPRRITAPSPGVRSSADATPLLVK